MSLLFLMVDACRFAGPPSLVQLDLLALCSLQLQIRLPRQS
ncbi:hypothetical protein HanPSC8_Chr02g0081511 [Helianthus annuus]|nr:hypothetical protein HanPSC8_Chr02g0081511 [Helianthus annuus]